MYCRRETLDENGMVVDFTQLKRTVSEALDHRCLNDSLPFNPTAENLARYLCEQIPHCYKVSVQESEGNEALYVCPEAEGAEL